MSILETVTPILGVGATQKDTVPRMAPGTPVHGRGGRVMIYVQAPGIVGANSTVTLDTGTISFAAASVASGAWTNGSVAFAAGEYGWVFKNV
jgi:hypothetical protein